MEDRLYWKDGARCAVMLSFDLDGDTTWKNGNAHYPGGDKFLKAASVGSYGPRRGAHAILDLLKKYDLRGTFFVPGKVAEDNPDLIRRIDAEGHEIGQHGYTHELFFSYTLEQQAAIIDRCQNIFCDLIGKPAQGFRTPSGDWSRGTPKLLFERGINYSSSMRGNDRPYHTVIDGKKTDFIEIPTRWELDDYVATAYNYFPSEPDGQDRISGYELVYDNMSREFDGYYEYGLSFVTLIHPQVTGQPGRLRILDHLLAHIKERGDVWFARGCELAAWYRQHYDEREVRRDV